VGATQAVEAIRWCRELAACSEVRGTTTRTFLSSPMRDVHARLEAWMRHAGMDTYIDHAGNLRGLYPGATAGCPRLLIGSHLDTVVDAGPFDGVLGVVIAITLVDLLGGKRLPFGIEVVGFSDEEGVRFGVPFIGSRALIGTLDRELLDRRDAEGRSVADVIRDYGLDPSGIDGVSLQDANGCVGYLEFHIEQGPVLDRLGRSLAVVDTIVGQSRLLLTFRGAANHAGTTPMAMRRDALACAAEWIVAAEAMAADTKDLVATVGRINARPGVTNAIAGTCEASLDVRHANDAIRTAAVSALVDRARQIAGRRGIDLQCESRLDQKSVAMDGTLTALMAQAIESSGAPVVHMASGAGHDAMVMARCVPAAMLFIRSPGGISHHPDEDVREEDVAAALDVGESWLTLLARSRSW